MGILRQVSLRKPAKTLSDIEIPEAVWKSDFDIVDRYQGFANELMRIALLGIGGYGFLIKESMSKDSQIADLFRGTYTYLALGAISLGLTLVLALAHRFYSTACLYHQVLIVRSLKRLENEQSQWTEKEKDLEREFLAKTRTVQRKTNSTSRYILIGTSIFFGTGFLFVIVVFLGILHRTCGG